MAITPYILKTIALLCTIPSGDNNAERVDYLQLQCQKYYVKCLGEGSSMKTDSDNLSMCILKRQVIVRGMF